MPSPGIGDDGVVGVDDDDDDDENMDEELAAMPSNEEEADSAASSRWDFLEPLVLSSSSLLAFSAPNDTVKSAITMLKRKSTTRIQKTIKKALAPTPVAATQPSIKTTQSFTPSI